MKAGLVHWDQWADGLPLPVETSCANTERIVGNRTVIGLTLGAASGNGFSCVPSLRSKTGSAAEGRRHGTREGVRREKGWYDKRGGGVFVDKGRLNSSAPAWRLPTWCGLAARPVSPLCCSVSVVFEIKDCYNKFQALNKTRTQNCSRKTANLKTSEKYFKILFDIACCKCSSEQLNTLADTLRKPGATNGSNIPARSF